MESEALAAAAFAVGTAENLLKGGPQLVRTALRGHVDGLSAGAVWLAVLANALWASFGAAISDVPFLALSLFGLLLTSATAARFAARTGWRRNASPGAVTVASAVGCAALAGMGEDQALAVIGVTLGLLISLPQVVHLVRIRKMAQDVSGVSTWSTSW